MRGISRWLACLTLLHGLSPAIAGDAATAPMTVHTVATGVYLHTGTQAEANPDNGGDIANIGFIVGGDCVAVIDTGGSPAIGGRLHQAVEAATDKPICYVINTHMHPDHVLGNRAFVAADTKFIAAQGFDRELAARSGRYLERVSEILGVATDSDWVVMPDRMIEDSTTLELGARTLELRAWPTGHTNNDLSVYDRKSKTLWAGDLLFVDRVPSVDGSVPGWLEVLGQLQSQYARAATVVPGHGPVSHDLAAAIAPERRYLAAIRDAVEDALAAGYGLRYTSTHAATSEHTQWLLFDDYHAANVTAAYTELEWQ